ncbi:MAG: hypothetical protein HY760_04840, partial [Nitrospirae bacterium]|nr:hypothetical protein [Nitrospirota bacterium]
MITRESFVRLNQVKGNGHTILSVYLNVNPVTSPKGEYFVNFRNLVREEVVKIEGGQKLLTEDIRKVENYIKGGRKEFKKTLVIFASDSLGLWEVHHLSVPLRNQVVADKSPYLKPLAGLMEANPADLIVLVDREHARLFKITQGEILEYAELTTEDIPRKHKKGGWYGRDENRFRRRIEAQVSFHLKDVIREMENQLAAGDVGRILLGGAEEAVALFQKMLSQATAAKIAGTFPAEIQANDDEILSRARELIRKVDREREVRWVEELLTRAGKEGSAAVGLEDVLSGLQEGKIHRLIYQETFQAGGSRCPGCGFLSGREMDACPYCKTAVERVDHLVDYVLQKALDQGVHLSSVAE